LSSALFLQHFLKQVTHFEKLINHSLLTPFLTIGKKLEMNLFKIIILIGMKLIFLMEDLYYIEYLG